LDVHLEETNFFVESNDVDRGLEAAHRGILSLEREGTGAFELEVLGGSLAVGSGGGSAIRRRSGLVQDRDARLDLVHSASCIEGVHLLLAVSSVRASDRLRVGGLVLLLLLLSVGALITAVALIVAERVGLVAIVAAVALIESLIESTEAVLALATPRFLVALLAEAAAVG
jgi:hypothetical protein